MKRNARQAAKVRAELRQAAERAAALRAHDPDREVRLASALAQPRSKAFWQALSMEASVQKLLAIVAARAPRLLKTYAVELEVIASHPHLRPAGTWVPDGKGRDRLFRSLVSHLFAMHPMPPVIWSGFLDGPQVAALVVWIASGGSFNEYVKTRFPIPLTRRMCHDVLDVHGVTSFLTAIRQVQVTSHGGDPRVAGAFALARGARTVGEAAREAFLASVAEWIARAGVQPADVGPIVDFVVARRAQDVTFSMKGRTPAALRIAMTRWHAELAAERAFALVSFRPSGFAPIRVEREVRGIREIWRVEEILSSRELVDEGRRMSHCVASYAPSIARGAISIWVMTKEDGTGPTGRWAQLTIEVDHARRAIVQARGRFNRLATNEERAILARFAARNALTC